MSKRNYNQVCALARSLDIVGERWTLMIVRELLFGPRRYSDLLRELPGLGTNLLAQRLKDLEQAGIIAQRRLPPPAASAVYELTPNGRTSLRPVIRALTDFGLSYLQYPPPAGDFVPASSTMGALYKFFQPDRATGVSLSVELHTDEDVFICSIKNGEMAELGFGTLTTSDLVLTGSTATFMGLIVGYLTVTTVLATNQLTIEKGEVETVINFFDLFEGEHSAVSA